MADSTLSFVAEDVGADTTEYTPECVVYLIARSSAEASGTRESQCGDARIVSLGESTHGSREIFQMKHRLVEYLS